MKSINYKSGINKILSDKIGNGTITKSGIDLLNRLLLDLNSKLISTYLDITNGASKMTIKHAEKAVDDLFTENLKRLALAEGSKIVCLYSNGLIECKPQKETFQRKKKGEKALIITSKVFTKGLSELTSSDFPQASLSAQPTKIICEGLKDIAVKISDYVQAKEGNCIKEEDVRDAILNLLPEQMLHHAIAEGTRMTFLYETGRLEEYGRTRRTARRQLSKSRETTPSRRRSPEKLKSRKTTPSRRRSPEKRERRRTTMSRRRRPEKRKRRRTTQSRKRSPEKRKRRRTTPSRKRSPEKRKSRRTAVRPKRRKVGSTKRIQKRKRRTTKDTEIKPESRTSSITKRLKRKRTSTNAQRRKRTPDSTESLKRRRTTQKIKGRKATRSKDRTIESPAKRKSRKSATRTKKHKTRPAIKTRKLQGRTSATSPLKFTRGVSESASWFFRQAEEPTSLTAQSTKIICEMLQELAVTISHFVQKKAGNYIKLEDIRRAIVMLLPNKLSRFVIAEGARMIFLHEEA